MKACLASRERAEEIRKLFIRADLNMIEFLLRFVRCLFLEF